jgi:hypothetical protein
MVPPWNHAADLLSGRLLGVDAWPLSLAVTLCDLRPRFLPKGSAGRGHRAIARNGRILLASDLPVTDLAGRPARIRLQTWHRALLPGDPLKPHGLLLCLRCADTPDPLFTTELVSEPTAEADLVLAVGGGRVLEFRGCRRSSIVRIATSR